MNHDAAAAKSAPYRLWVEGHVSAALHGAAHARAVSLSRAALCASMVRARLLELDAGLNAAHTESMVCGVGMGHMRPLVGVDDGGNYAENRRVEFHVQPLSVATGDGPSYHVDVYPASCPT
jgi:hypothetical protein